jgi:hypothetical protein
LNEFISSDSIERLKMNQPLRVSSGHENRIRRRLKKIGVMLPLLAISGWLGVSLSAPRLARAGTGQIFLETMGISIAVGTVLGASTLPFYDQPGKHLMNLAYGASAGAVVGIGALVYQWIADPGQDDYGQAGEGSPSLAGFKSRRHLTGVTPLDRVDQGRVVRMPRFAGPDIAQGDYVAPRSGSSYPVQFWTPLVSLNW